MVGVASALVLAVMLATRVPAPVIEQVATLTDEKAQTALVVTADVRKRSMDVRVADTVTVPSDKSLHLWAIPRSGGPRSLGVLLDNRHATLALSDKAIGSDVVMLAISLEPKGGSPDPNGPTGPVIYKGSWVKLL
jgi:anti-sigma-K factor RskA